MHRTTIAGLVLLLAISAPAIAHAEDPRKEVSIVRASGETVRGEIVERVEGESCTVLLEDDTVITIPWRDIKSIDGRDTGPKAYVTLRAPSTVQLQHREQRRWVTACFAPCNANLSRDGDYRIVDERGQPKSTLFTLNSSSVVVELSPRSGAIDGMGVLSAIGGLAFMVAGTSGREPNPGLSGFGLGALCAGVAVILLNGSSVNVLQNKEQKTARAPTLTLTSPLSFEF